MTVHVWIHFEQNQCTEKYEACIFNLFTGLFNASENNIKQTEDNTLANDCLCCGNTYIKK